jgi:hypothetical protein
VNALQNDTGSLNTATGFKALNQNNSGTENTATGANALFSNTTGSVNTAVGSRALYSNNAGFDNTVVGVAALYHNTSGANNIALGAAAGTNITTGSQNIEIGNQETTGDANTIRIGTQGQQTATFIAGISAAGVTGADVLVSSSGRLGVPTSSARFKRDIRDMGQTSGNLMQLRPVTFVYKNDPQGTRQYGLVAEEVERVYPELVTYDADGKIETVRYSMLTSMLLNELQKQKRENQR